MKGVTVPISTEEKPNLNKPLKHLPDLSKPAARPIGFLNYRLDTFVDRMGTL